MSRNNNGLIGLIYLLWKNKVILIVIVLSFTMLSIIISLLLPKTYKADVTVLISKSRSFSIPGIEILSNLGIPSGIGLESNLNKVMTVLKSRTLLERIIERFQLQERYRTDSFEKTLKKLRSNVKINVGEESQIIISVFDRDKYKAAEIANYLVYAADSILRTLNYDVAYEIRTIYENKYKEVIDSIKFYENKLKLFMDKYNVISLPDQLESWISMLAEVHAQLAVTEVEYNVALKTYGRNTPSVNQLKMRIDAFRDKYNELLNNPHNEKLIFKSEEVPKIEVLFSQIRRNLTYYTKVLEYLGPVYEQARLNENKMVSIIQVVDKAIPPERKAKPKRAKIVVLTFIFSSLLGIYYIYFKDKYNKLKDRIKKFN
ncbi:MAG: hypothetical protein H0Z29_04425 [Candidatus Marinimicrobia bacterium]|nr:hypothetical protein [Candidatus Neomarinimicrobiota bacterium]